METKFTIDDINLPTEEQLIASIRCVFFINESPTSYSLELFIKEGEELEPLDTYKFKAGSGGSLPFFQDISLVVKWNNQYFELNLNQPHVDHYFKISKDYTVSISSTSEAYSQLNKAVSTDKVQHGLITACIDKTSTESKQESVADDEDDKFYMLSLFNNSSGQVSLFLNIKKSSEENTPHEFILEPYEEILLGRDDACFATVEFEGMKKESAIEDRSLCYCFGITNNKEFDCFIKTQREMKEGSKEYLRDHDNPYIRIFRAAVYNDHTFVEKALESNKELIYFEDRFRFSLLSVAAHEGYTELVKNILAYKGHARDFSGNQALWGACERGHDAIAELLIQQGATVSYTNYEGATALHMATDRGHASIVELLLKTYPMVDAQTKAGQTALLLAVINQHKSIVELLLRYRAFPHITNNEGVTPLRAAAQMGNYEIVELLLNYVTRSTDINEALYQACQSGHTKIVELLLKRGADSNYRIDSRATPLHIASVQGHIDIVKLLLLEKGAYINAQDSLGYTPLFCAVLENRQDVASFLMSNNADVNLITREGATALHAAIQKEYKELVELLLKNKARLDSATLKEHYTPLILALAGGHTEIAHMLLTHDFDQAVKKELTYLIVVAAAQNQREILELLIKLGISIDAEDENGISALQRMVMQAHYEGIKLLLELGANPNRAKKEDLLPLILAAVAGKKDIVALLLQYGADVNSKTKIGSTPLDLAFLMQHKEVCHLLLDHGAISTSTEFKLDHSIIDMFFESLGN